MKIGFIGNANDPSNPLRDQSVAYYIFKHFVKNGIKPVVNLSMIKGLSQIRYYNKKLISKLGRSYYDASRDEHFLRINGQDHTSFLEKNNCDISFSFGSLPQSYIKADVIKGFWTDATFNNISNYYFYYEKIDKKLKDGYNKLEKEILSVTDIKVFASNWAKEDAIKYYDQDKDQCFELPLGANLENPPLSNDILKVINNKSFDKIRIVFIGVDWQRKGGEYILKIIEIFKQNNIKYEINCFGVIPNLPDQEGLFFHGFIKKSNPKEFKILEDCLINSHFHIMMSEAEAFGHVYCEANAYGLPSIARDTGGVSSVIKDSVNGFIYNDSNDFEEFLHDIIDTFNNQNEYIELAKSSLNEYHTRLNWNTSINKLIDLLEQKLTSYL